MGRIINTIINYKRTWRILIYAGLLLTGISLPAAASYIPFNTNINMNVGIGTSTPQGAFIVMGGNVGIGTWSPRAGFEVMGGGISTDFRISRLGNPSVFLSFASESGTVGVAKMGVSGVNVLGLGVDGGLQVGNNFIGGDSPPTNGLAVGGNVGIGTFNPFGGGLVVLPANTGNVGIGSLVPGQALDVQGTVRMTGLTLTGNGAANGNVLVGNSIGVGTWMPASTLVNSAGSNYWSLTAGVGNVGISTTNTVGIGTTAASAGTGLVVMNGNVGIGTWVPGYELEIDGGGVGVGVNSNAAYLQIGQLANSQSVPNGLSLKDYITSTASNQSEAEVEAIARAGANTGSTYFGIVGDVNNNLASAVNYTASIGLAGVAGYTTSSGSGTITGVASLFAGNSSYTGSGGGISNAYGVFVSDQTAATNNYGVYSGLSSGANKWNFYGNGTAPNYFNGNVGIGSIVPGQILDVQGTIRTTGLTLTGNGAANGNVLVTNGVGVGTWMSPSTLFVNGGTGSNYWLNDIGNVGINTTYNIGLGTISAVNTMNILGNIGIGTFSYDPYMKTSAPSGGMIISGNVGIGTWVTTGTGELSIVSNGAENPLYIAPQNNGGYDFIVNEYGQLMMGGANNAGTLNVDGQTYLINTLGNSGSVVLTVEGTSPQTADIIQAQNNGGAVLFDVMASGNVGIGTVKTTGGLSVMNGNVGIGTWVPGSVLDVNGSARMTGFILTGNGAAASNVLVSNGIGVGTWMPASTLPGAGSSNYWFNDTGNVGINTSYSVGIGTISAVNKLNILGNIGIGTISYSPFLTTAAPNGGMIVEGNIGVGSTAPGATVDVQGNIRVSNGAAFNVFTTNVGIYSASPGAALDVQGMVRTTAFTLNNSPAAGDILMTNAVGVGTWIPASAVASGGSIASNYWALNGGAGNVGINTSYAVGIGTAFVGGTGEAALSVMNGNVGIGTWKPGAALDFPYYPSGGSAASGIGFGASLGIGNGFNLYQNSSNTMQFNVVAGLYIDNDFGQGINLQPGHLGAIVHYGDDASTASQFFQFGTDANITGLSTANGELIQTASVFAPSSGTFNYSAININDTFNQTGTSAGITRGLFVNPKLTSALDFRAIETSIGNVGIGTISGNLGIGSQWPGQRLDVNGTARMGGFTLTGNGASSGNVLVTNGIGVGTWMSTTTLPIATVAVETPGDVTYYNAPNGFAGGTGFQTNGTNVGIGTSNFTNASLQVVGNIGIGTVKNGDNFINNPPPNGGMIIEGNVGIGTWLPAHSLDLPSLNTTNSNVRIGDLEFQSYSLNNSWIGENTYWNGTNFVARQTGATGLFYFISPEGQFRLNSSVTAGSAVSLNGQLKINADGTFAVGPSVSTNLGNYTGADFLVTSAGNVGIGSLAPGQNLDVQGTIRGLGEIVNGNVGIGTSFITGGAALTVMNGNVGIGTWLPAYNLDLVNNTARMRPVRRIVSFAETTTATVTINSNTTDVAEISGYNNTAGITLTIANPSPSTPNDEDLLEIRVLDGGTAITIAYGTNFSSTTTTLPLTTVASTWLRILFEYNSATSKWECVAST